MTRLSIIICTRNRAASLRRTLAALAGVNLPPGTSAEVVVVDNGSTDETASVAVSPTCGAAVLRYFSEPEPGQSRARNRGLAEAGGDIIIFTDDDVLPAADWLVQLCAPILKAEADAAAGCVRMAPHLMRPWMSPAHCAWLAGTDTLDPKTPDRLVGANMAFSRSVLVKVPAFDVELGPGALGFGDDTLFAQQLKAAGYRIAPAFEAVVEHHFQEDRLTPRHWLLSAKKLGQVDAYMGHHWENSVWPHPYRRACLAWLRWVRCRLRAALPGRKSPAPETLLTATRSLHARLHYLRERKRPPNYEYHGLVKRPAGEDHSGPLSIRLTKQHAGT